MGTKDKSELTATETRPTWAKQLAQRRKARREAPDHEADAESQITEAIQILWEMFDDAVEQAQAALIESGSEERVEIRRTSHDYQLSMSGPDGEPRNVAKPGATPAASHLPPA
jgi:hypothetical protein